MEGVLLLVAVVPPPRAVQAGRLAVPVALILFALFAEPRQG